MFVSLFFIYLSLLYYLCFLANKDAHKAVILCKTRSIITVKSNDLGPTARLTSVSFVLKRVGRVYLLFASNSITQHQYVGRRTVQPPQWECSVYMSRSPPTARCRPARRRSPQGRSGATVDEYGLRVYGFLSETIECGVRAAASYISCRHQSLSQRGLSCQMLLVSVPCQ